MKKLHILIFLLITAIIEGFSLLMADKVYQLIGYIGIPKYLFVIYISLNILGLVATLIASIYFLFRKKNEEKPEEDEEYKKISKEIEEFQKEKKAFEESKKTEKKPFWNKIIKPKPVTIIEQKDLQPQPIKTQTLLQEEEEKINTMLNDYSAYIPKEEPQQYYPEPQPKPQYYPEEYQEEQQGGW